MGEQEALMLALELNRISDLMQAQNEILSAGLPIGMVATELGRIADALQPQPDAAWDTNLDAAPRGPVMVTVDRGIGERTVAVGYRDRHGGWIVYGASGRVVAWSPLLAAFQGEVPADG